MIKYNIDSGSNPPPGKQKTLTSDKQEARLCPQWDQCWSAKSLKHQGKLV